MNHIKNELAKELNHHYMESVSLKDKEQPYYAILNCNRDEAFNSITDFFNKNKNHIHKGLSISISEIGTIIHDRNCKEHVCSEEKTFLKFTYQEFFTVNK